jgi:hypothetical protein
MNRSIGIQLDRESERSLALRDLLERRGVNEVRWWVWHPARVIQQGLEAQLSRRGREEVNDTLQLRRELGRHVAEVAR